MKNTKNNSMKNNTSQSINKEIAPSGKTTTEAPYTLPMGRANDIPNQNGETPYEEPADNQDDAKPRSRWTTCSLRDFNAIKAVSQWRGVYVAGPFQHEDQACEWDVYIGGDDRQPVAKVYSCHTPEKAILIGSEMANDRGLELVNNIDRVS